MTSAVSIETIGAGQDRDGPVWTAVRELCCRTGNNGAAIPSEHWEIFGEIWIEPYRRLSPDWTYVALAHGRVVGYLTGCPDTVSFARRYYIQCALPLLAQVTLGRFRHDLYGRSFLRGTLWLERSALRSFPWQLRRRMPQSFPAHLHMNVEAPFRRAGIGKRLLERFVDDLRQRQVAGVHLLCGGDPVPFYRRMGFAELAVVPVRGHDVHAMGLSL